MDKAFVDLLVEALTLAGYRIYQETSEMAKGDDVEPALFDAIDRSYKVIAVLSPDAAASPM